MTFFLTCFAAGEDYVESMGKMVESFREFHPDVPVVRGTFPVGERSWGEITNFKPTWLRKTWEQWKHLGDMLWVDADARFKARVTEPVGRFHIAGKKYSRRSMANKDDLDRISTGTLLFRDVTDNLFHDWVYHANHSAHDEAALQYVMRGDESHLYFELPDTYTTIRQRGTDASIVHWLASDGVWPEDTE